MALTYDQISAITEKKFIPKMYDDIFDSNPLLQRMKSKSYEKIDGGTSILVPLNYAQTSASGWYAGADVLSTTDNDQITAAEYAWKQLYVNISLSRRDELINSGDPQKLALVKNKVKIAEKTMEDLMGVALYNSGTDAKAVVGLRSIVGTANTVGGISQSTNSWWQAQVDSSSTTLTQGVIQTQFSRATIGNDGPTVIMATRAIYDIYYSILQPQQRFQDSDTAKGGFSSLMYNSVPFIADSHCPASHLFILNENYLHLFAHKDEDMRFEPFVKPLNQNVRSAKVYWMGALGTSNCRMLGKLSAITA